MVTCAPIGAGPGTIKTTSSMELCKKPGVSLHILRRCNFPQNSNLGPPLNNLLARDVPSMFTLLEKHLTDEPVMLVASSSAKGGPVPLGAFSPALLARANLASAISSGKLAGALVVAPNGQVLLQMGLPNRTEAPAAHPGVAEALRRESGTTYLSVGGQSPAAHHRSRSSGDGTPGNPALSGGWGLVHVAEHRDRGHHCDGLNSYETCIPIKSKTQDVRQTCAPPGWMPDQFFLLKRPNNIETTTN